MITVYTKPACGGCIATKRHLTRLGLQFAERPIDGILERAQAAGVTSAPVVVVDDDQIWGGYRPERLEALAGLTALS